MKKLSSQELEVTLAKFKKQIAKAFESASSEQPYDERLDLFKIYLTGLFEDELYMEFENIKVTLTNEELTEEQLVYARQLCLLILNERRMRALVSEAV